MPKGENGTSGEQQYLKTLGKNGENAVIFNGETVVAVRYLLISASLFVDNIL